MKPDEFHVVEWKPVASGEVRRVRGARKTAEELAEEAEAEAAPEAVLQVRIIDGCNTPGGKSVLLCDEEGKPLPLQRNVVLDQDGDMAQITVTFFIDGERVVFA